MQALPTEQGRAGQLADLLITREVMVQDQMWGESNERSDATEDQLIDAAMAQLSFVRLRDLDEDEGVALQAAKEEFYPDNWDGFRSYGSRIANLVVAAAYIRSEIKRSLLKGEPIVRTKRNEVTQWSTEPYMSSDEALKHVPPDHLPPEPERAGHGLMPDGSAS